ncbi:membrane protein involved in aromatic hydrocarbon degradation [Geobacter metallireducens RCH3]|uniref:Aromatic hydrocarbon degradation outer membrane protein n=1 Tax=Geobacter metallireducens (strain ATCC 53774 / DSM 7210 / GS-15) TaxID=269799 RepID=Q39VF5_GEOMG|nr:outer membrane protein transport protein [Geobacter metallireducens]ABB31769.1 aromatic hydrocarbon degradation outer membrane protein [Geobacter metallireducens GS-15]EHP89352.1 membrane protein involved in aromatic hydrocarbon degradation [Geobacter metallireducens RCH3]
MKYKIVTPYTLAMVAIIVSTTLRVSYATDVFRLEGFGPVSRGMGGAATAFDVGAAGMMTNPATLSLMGAGSEIHVGLDVVVTDISAKNKATGENASSDSHSNNRGPYAAPEAGFVYRAAPLTLGFGAFAQGGLGTEYGRNTFLSRASGNLDTGLDNSSRLLVLNVPFAITYDINEKLTIGAAIDAMWEGLNLELLLPAEDVGALIQGGRVTGSLLPVLGGLPDLRGAHFSMTKNQPIASGIDAWGFGARIGGVYKLSKDTIIGAAYTMESRMADMEGNATMTAVDGSAGQIPLKGKIKLGGLQMPAQLDIGVSHQINEHWLVVADISRVFWKNAVKDLKVHFVTDNGEDIHISLPQNYKDQMIYSLGVAYRTGHWTLRCGGRIASQAMRSDTVIAVIPAIPTKHASAGFSYDFSAANTVDFAYSHAFEESFDNANTRLVHSQNNFSIAYTHRF